MKASDVPDEIQNQTQYRLNQLNINLSVDINEKLISIDEIRNISSSSRSKLARFIKASVATI